MMEGFYLIVKMSKEVNDKLIRALRAEGCLITISELRAGKLEHYQYHKTIPKGDFEIILKGIRALLSPFFPNKDKNMISTIKEYSQ